MDEFEESNLEKETNDSTLSIKIPYIIKKKRKKYGIFPLAFYYKNTAA